jgi:hypothetical protein
MIKKLKKEFFPTYMKTSYTVRDDFSFFISHFLSIYFSICNYKCKCDFSKREEFDADKKNCIFQNFHAKKKVIDKKCKQLINEWHGFDCVPTLWCFLTFFVQLFYCLEIRSKFCFFRYLHGFLFRHIFHAVLSVFVNFEPIINFSKTSSINVHKIHFCIYF